MPKTKRRKHPRRNRYNAVNRVQQDPLNEEGARAATASNIEEAVVDDVVAPEGLVSKEKASIFRTLSDWGFSVANDVGARGKSAWNSGKNVVNTGMAYVSTAVPNGIDAAWKVVDAGMKFSGSYLPSRATVVNTFNNILDRVWSTDNGTPVDQQTKDVDHIEQQAKEQIQRIVDKNSKAVSDSVVNGTSLVDLLLPAVSREEQKGVALYLNNTIKSLQEGKKPFISIIQEVNGDTRLMNCSTVQFLNNPESVSIILHALLGGGLTKKFHIISTTAEEAVALAIALDNGCPERSFMCNADALFQQESGALILPGKRAVGNLSEILLT